MNHDYTQRRTNHTKPVKLVTATRADGKPVLTGYAAVFYRADDPGTQYTLWQDAVERIMPTAFDAALREGDDVRGLFNHDVSLILGRKAAGTCRLFVDEVGLRYEIDPPDSPTGKNVLEAVARGDVTGSSFSFLVYSGKRGRVVWVDEKQADGRLLSIREIHDLELLDVGPVTFPAYTSTTAGSRSIDADAEQLRRELSEYRWGRSIPTPEELDLLVVSSRAMAERRTG